MFLELTPTVCFQDVDESPPEISWSSQLWIFSDPISFRVELRNAVIRSPRAPLSENPRVFK